MIKRIYVKVKNFGLTQLNRGKFFRDIKEIDDKGVVNLLEFSYDKKLFGGDVALSHKVEGLRKGIIEDSDLIVKTYGSPHSNSPLFDESGKVIPGSFLDHSIKGVAQTGTNQFGGVQLKRIIDAFGKGHILELGTNTGLSGCYFISSENAEHLYTIEGSSDLCRIAEKNLQTVGKNFTVFNGLFDDILEKLNKKCYFMYAFIDGQHEKNATLHYMEKIIPMMKNGGLIIFDDIYWSEGMNDAWKTIQNDNRFDLVLDFGWRGVVRLSPANTESGDKFSFDLTRYHGKPNIQRPGW